VADGAGKLENWVSYRPGGTAIAVADGGTGSSTATGARTALGLQIGTDVQGHSAELDAVSGLAVGLATRTGSGTWSARMLTGTNNRISVANGDGAAGSPAIDIGSDVVTLTANQTLTNKTLTSPAISGGAVSALTSLGVRSSGAAFDLKLAMSEAISADRTWTVKLNNANRTLDMGGDLVLASALATSGAYGLTLTTTATTSVTLPTAGTLATLAGAETLTNKTLTAPDVNGGTIDNVTSFGIRSSGASYDLQQRTLEAITNNKVITWTVNNADRSINLAGDLVLAGSLSTSGAYGLVLTVTATTNVTLPTSGTLATRAGTEALTNKTFGMKTVTLTDASSIAWDMSAGTAATVTLTASGHTMAAPSNLPAAGTTGLLCIIQDATGNRTLAAWNGIFKWPGNTPITLSTGANKRDFIGWYCDGTNIYMLSQTKNL
jgi:hypothetical protein